jgi:cysteine synthase A
MPKALPSIGSSILESIGRTPLVQLNKVVPKQSARVLVKLEYFNPTGSYKDRSALSMIELAEARGDLRPGMKVVERTAGSTGSSLALICSVKGYLFAAVTIDTASKEKLDTMRLFGAELDVMHVPDGKMTPEFLQQMTDRIEVLVNSGNAYYTGQISNPDNPKGYASIGHELLEQAGGKIDAFCAAVGTAGMLVGVSRVLKQAHPSTQVIALEPLTSPVVSQQRVGPHGVEGIAFTANLPLLDRSDYDQVLGIDETEAARMTVRLAREEGVFSGTSSGMNVVGALRLAQTLGTGHTVATVACDSGLKYLSAGAFDLR